MFLKYKELLYIIIITIVSLYIITAYIQTELDHLNEVSLNNVLDICKTGDLIITRWNFVDIGYRLFCKYCHVCIIYRTNDNIYLIETHPDEIDEDDHTRSGVNVYLLKDRIQNYEGTCYFLQLRKQNNNYTTQIEKNLELYKSIPFSNDFRFLFVKNWIYHRLNIPNNEKDSMYCSELIGFILQDINILDKKYTFLSPDSFEHLLDIYGNRLYSNSKRIFF